MALTQIRGSSQIQDLSITNAQIALPDENNPDGILLTKIQDGSLLVKSDGSVSFTDTVSGVTPTADAHLATKAYVDATAQGLDVKLSVRALSLDDITLSGTQTIDAVSLVVGDRVLVAGQTDSTENGIYVVAVGSWARSADADANAEVTPGMFTFVEEGTFAMGTGWVLTSTGTTVLGTTELPFAQFSSAGVVVAGAGLTRTGNVVDVVSANGGIVVSADDIALTLDGSTLSVGAGGLKLADLASGKFLIGSAGNVATAQTISGDITVTAGGVAAVAALAITTGKLADAAVTAPKLASDAVTTVKILDANVTTAKLADQAVTLAKIVNLAAGEIIVGTTGGPNAAVTLSGDVTMDEAGVVTINPATVVRVADIITRETPTGLVNGVNDTYVLANTPKVGTESVFVNGLLQDSGAGNDYTIADDTITMLYLLTTGDKLRVSYFK